jgi:ClpX C4-type zinc finger
MTDDTETGGGSAARPRATLGDRVFLTPRLGPPGGAPPVALLASSVIEPRRCLFCGRRQTSVQHLVGVRGAYICELCVTMAQRAIRDAAPDRRLLRIRPRPPRPPDLEAAERAVEEAFETVYRSDHSDQARLAAIEGGAGLGPTMEQARRARQRFRGTSEMDILLEDIRFVSEDEAEVSFVLLFPAEPLSRLSNTGTAVLADGSWKVSRQTYCNLVKSLGVQCPPAAH